MNEIITRIAQEVLEIETLETRRSDELDFHEVSVWGLRAALEAAYKAGRVRGGTKRDGGMAVNAEQQAQAVTATTERVKVVSENTILDTLSNGGKIRWHTIYSKAQLLSKTGEVLGTIRFDTYLRVVGYSWIEKTGADYSYTYYGHKAA